MPLTPNEQAELKRLMQWRLARTERRPTSEDLQLWDRLRDAHARMRHYERPVCDFKACPVCQVEVPEFVSANFQGTEDPEHTVKVLQGYFGKTRPEKPQDVTLSGEIMGYRQ